MKTRNMYTIFWTNIAMLTNVLSDDLSELIVNDWKVAVDI